jgi:uncharacterized coiled-coil protein SlyX
MRFNQCALVQYRFYLVENGLAPLVRDANAYLRKIGCDGQEVDEQRLKEALANLGETGGRQCIQSVENKCDADHVVVVHVYHDTYILQLIANAKQGVGWKRLNQTLQCCGIADGIGEALLFQGVYDESKTREDVLNGCGNLARSLGIRASSLKWCRLDAGYFVQLSDTDFVLASPQQAQTATDKFVLQTFPQLMMQFFKARFQKEQYDYLLALMNGKEIQPPPNLSPEELEEWKRHCGVIPALEAETNETVAFVTENEAAIRIIGSREAQELIGRLQHLRLSYARLAKAVSDADRMRDSIFVNIKNYLNLIEQLEVKEDGGFISATRRIQEVTRETLSHELLRHRAIVERTQTVLAALNEHAQELRDLQAQEEARLQSMQTSLIAAIASLIGVGQLFASIPAMMRWDMELKVWFLILAGMGTFALSHVAFNLRRANTWVDYLCSSVAFGVAFLTFYLWSSRYSRWATTICSALPYSGWTKVSLFALGFIIGLGVTLLLDRFVAWWVRGHSK